MADGSIIKTLGVCHGVTVLIQGYKFVVDFNVLHLGGCVVVLGIQWLCKLGEIICGFKLLTMRFCYLGKEVFLQGLHMSPSTFSEADKLFSSSEKKGLVLQIAAINNVGSDDQPLLPAALSDLLDQFSKVFEVPIGLPLI